MSSPQSTTTAPALPAASSPPPSAAASSASSGANSDDYEIVSSTAAANSEVSGPGQEEPVKLNLADCLASSTEGEEDEVIVTAAAPPLQPPPGPSAAASPDQDTDHTVFHQISYLGAQPIEQPKNEPFIQTQIKAAASSTTSPHDVILSVPRTSDGFVYLRDQEHAELHRFPVCRIIFFARGTADTSESDCFAITCVHTDSTDSLASRHFKTYIFRCQVEEAVQKVFVSFAQAFKRPKAAPSDHFGAQQQQQLEEENFDEQEAFLFELNLEIREREDKHTFEVVPRQRGLFKLRSNVEKRVVVSVQQLSRNSCHLNVERCFGMLVSPGRNVRHADMQLLEHVTMATTQAPHEGFEGDDANSVSHVLTGVWDPSETAFALLNKETPADVQSVYMTIAADLVMQQVAEPVRFVIETKARIYPAGEKYWYYTKKSLTKQYQVRLKRSAKPAGGTSVTDGADPEKVFDLCGIDMSEEIERSKLSLTSQLASLTASTLGSLRNPVSYSWAPEEPTSPRADEDEEDDGEEALLSGFGEVSKDCSVSELDLWSQVLKEWDLDKPLQYPKQLTPLVRRGVPEALRGEVWQRVTGASSQMDHIIEAYRVLTTKESPDEKVILRDIHRTFPAHEFFREAGGVGQESLYRISKAYSVYDSEIGYCQGQSFLIAALLLQMPEEQAFGVLVKVMHKLGLRDMFRENFEQLQLRLYQIDRLIETHFADLWQHFADVGLESHMYASQWFLTVFTAKFPLFLVFRVLDCFLLFGFDTIFQVALGILKVSRKDLLNLDFEGLMKYFRVNVPKRYRNEENARHLMDVANGIKLKKLHKYEKEWLSLKAAERAREDPAVRFERENKKLLGDNLRLDTENDNLARQLVNSKIEMRKEIDALEDEKDVFEKDLKTNKALYEETLEEKKRLEGETDSLKTLLKREVDKLDAELATRNNVIAEYKQICSQLSGKLEKAERGQGDAEEGEEDNSNDDDAGAQKSLDAANRRIRELELELAQTKLALVETECKNQDLTHQFNTAVQDLQQLQLQQQQQSSGGGRAKWFSKTLSSIKESAVAHAATAAGGSGSAAGSSRETLRKSVSVDLIKSEFS